MKPNDEVYREIYERTELRKHEREERERINRMIRGLFPVEVLPKNEGEPQPADTTENLDIPSIDPVGAEFKGDHYGTN